MVKFDKHTFLKSISEFEIPATFSYQDLDDLLKKYPAFNSLQLINAVLTNKTNPELFNKNLSVTATKVLDRAILHDYIFKNKFTFKEAISEDKIKAAVVEDVIEKEIEEPIVIEVIPPVLEVKKKDKIVEEPIIEEIKAIEQVEPTVLKEEKLETVQPITEKVIEEPVTKKIQNKVAISFNEKKDEIVKNTSEKGIEKPIIEETKVAEQVKPIILKEEKAAATSPIIKKEVEEIAKPKALTEETSKTAGRDVVFKNLSDDLFKGKLESSSKASSEKDRKRIEAMKKLQDELFNTPKDKKKLPKKEIATKPKETAETPIKKEESKPVIEEIIVKPVIEKVVKKTLTEKITALIPEVEKTTIKVEKEITKEIPAVAITKKVIPQTTTVETTTTEATQTKELTPLEKIRLAKAKKQKNTTAEKARDLLNKLKIEQQNAVSIEKNKKEIAASTKDIEKPIEEAPQQKIEEKAVILEKNLVKEEEETHLGKIEKLKELFKANRLKDAEKAAIEKKTQIAKEEAIIVTAAPIEEKKTVIKTLTKQEETKPIETKKVITKDDFFNKYNTEKKESIKKEAIAPDHIEAKDSNFLEWLKHTKTLETAKLKEQKATIKPTEIVEEKFVEPRTDIIEKEIVPEPIIEEVVIEEPITKEVVEEEIVATAPVIQEPIVAEKIEQKIPTKKIESKKEDLIPFEKVSAIEHEMHLESKKSTDPLDDFISGQIARKKVVRTKKSSSNLGLISETLAEILVIQQKYTEAIEVYTTLSLKYPKKSIYFANQIEKIKNY